MSDLALSLVFAASAAVSLGSSWVLVSRLERVGARLGFSEALLGMVAALAANAPEITAAVTALATGQSRVGAGVVLGSNVFNLAALLGFATVVAGRIALHRRVIELQGAVASWVAVVAVVVVVGAISVGAGLALALAVLLPYLVALGVPHDRLRRLALPRSWSVWLTRAIEEEELELEPAIHPRRGRVLDVVLALAAVLVVVGASVAMERSASTLGGHLALSEIVLGGVVLAGVTSLPNAVAAVYLARRQRATATLSTALNSNTLNVAAGLLLPATLAGLSASSAPTTLVAAWYLGLTVFALVLAYVDRGLRRPAGVLIIVAYVVFVVVLAATYP
jgi:cation:H+ antiporter